MSNVVICFYSSSKQAQAASEPDLVDQNALAVLLDDDKIEMLDSKIILVDGPEPSQQLDKSELVQLQEEHVLSSASPPAVVHPEGLSPDDTCEYVCPVCSLAFSKKEPFSQHLESHSIPGIVFQCQDCKQEYADLRFLWQHQQLCSPKKPSLSPHFIDGNQKGQRKKQPYSQRLLQCQICRKIFKRKGSLLSHVHVHLCCRKHVCPPCGRAFSHRTSLLRHLVLSHMNNGCDLGYGLTGGGTEASDSGSSRRKSSRLRRTNHYGGTCISTSKYCCRLCKAELPSAAHLKKHFFLHEEDAEFSCCSCRLSFPFLDQLLLHECSEEDKVTRRSDGDVALVPLCSPKYHATIKEEVPTLSCETNPTPSEEYCDADLDPRRGRDEGSNSTYRYCDSDSPAPDKCQIPLETGGGGLFICQLCPETFDRDASLLAHFRAAHSRSKDQVSLRRLQDFLCYAT